MNRAAAEKGTAELENMPVRELINQWQEDYIEKLRELQKLRYDSRKHRAELTEEMHSFLNALLDALDEYDRLLGSVQAALSDEDRKAKRVLKNFASIRRKFAALTKQFGLKPIDIGDGEFISGLHKAVGVEERPGASEGQIIRVERQGYFWKNNILRPAEVVVSSPADGIGDNAQK